VGSAEENAMTFLYTPDGRWSFAAGAGTVSKPEYEVTIPWSVMELKNREEMKNEILQSWLRSAWVYPLESPDGKVYLRLTPGGRLKMRRRIGALEKSLGLEGVELARQEEAGTLPVERDKLELAMMAQAYIHERRFLGSQGASLGTPAVKLEEGAEGGEARGSSPG
jgi:hypothetical protein